MKNWDNLRFLLALARGGSPEDAGRLLKVDESTVRRRLTALEREAGAALFERTSTNWLLTRAGATLLQSAEQAEQAIASAEAGIDGNDPSLAGSVRIGAPDGIGSIVIAPALARLQQRAPGLLIDLATHGSPANISRREVDLLVALEMPESGPHRIRKLRSVVLKIYAAREYLETAPPIRSVDDLMQHRFIGYDPASDYADAAVRQLGENGLPMTSSFICSTVLAQSRAMIAGAGLALLPDYIIERGADILPVLPDQISLSIDLWLLTHADVAGRARVRAVADAIADAMAHKDTALIRG
jgi:DNA-binding transcriptional LysR family regulator